MTGDSTDKRPPGDRPRRGARREPALIDLKADSVETAADAAAEPPAGPATVPSDIEARPADVAAAETRLAGDAAPVSPLPASDAAALPDTHPEASLVSAEPPAAEPPRYPWSDAPAGVRPAAPDAAEPAPSASEEAARTARGDEELQPGFAQAGTLQDDASPAQPAEPAVSTVPPIGPAIRSSRPSLLGPALAGLAAGFVGAGLLTVGFLLFGPAGDIGDRLAGLENAVGERASRRTVEALDKRVGGLDGLAAGLRSDVDGLGKRVDEIPAADIPGLFGRVDRIERNLADLAAQPKAAPGQAAAPAPPPPPLVAARESAVLAIALLLRDALDRGAPYGRELEALQSAGVAAPTVAALQPFATSGAPGAPTLAREFAGLAERIANPPPPPPQSVSDRVSATFSGLFKVRPVGEAEGDSPAALAARAEALLQRGALKDAAATIDRIPPADAAPAAEFQARLKARIAASDAAATILSKAVDELLAAARLQGATR